VRLGGHDDTEIKHKKSETLYPTHKQRKRKWNRRSFLLQNTGFYNAQNTDSFFPFLQSLLLTGSLAKKSQILSANRSTRSPTSR
jgi:hypothetical protein